MPNLTPCLVSRLRQSTKWHHWQNSCKLAINLVLNCKITFQWT